MFTENASGEKFNEIRPNITQPANQTKLLDIRFKFNPLKACSNLIQLLIRPSSKRISNKLEKSCIRLDSTRLQQ